MKNFLKRILRAWIPNDIPPAVSYHPSEMDAEIIKEIVLQNKLTHWKGTEMAHLEKEFADYCLRRFSLATNSGTTALFLAVKALDIGRGDEVIVPAYTFVASAQAVLLAGATPVFSDIDRSGTISPRDIISHISKRTKAIMPVHLFGNPANMDAIMEIAQYHGLSVIEDCAQAIGAGYRGNPVGSTGDIGCFSFNEKKAVPAGQGGMFITNNQNLYERAKAIRNTGIVNTERTVDVITVGGTFFLTEMQAYLARAALRNLEHLNMVRKNNYRYLLELLRPIENVLEPISILPHAQPSFSRVVLLLKTQKLVLERNRLIKKLQLLGIPVQTFYPTPLPEYSLFKNKKKSVYRGSRYVCQRQIAMEWSPYWKPEHIRLIARSLIRTLR